MKKCQIIQYIIKIVTQKLNDPSTAFIKQYAVCRCGTRRFLRDGGLSSFHVDVDCAAATIKYGDHHSMKRMARHMKALSGLRSVRSSQTLGVVLIEHDYATITGSHQFYSYEPLIKYTRVDCIARMLIRPPIRYLYV